MDTALQAIIGVLGLFGAVYSVRRTGDWLNPVTMLLLFFFAPLFFAMSRLSGLQSTQWHYNTYLAVLTSVGAWLLYPTLMLTVLNRPAHSNTGLNFLEIGKSPYFSGFARAFGLLVVATYLFSNYIQTGHIVAFRNPEAAFQIHTVFPFGLRIIARAGVGAIVLLYLLFYVRRQKFDLMLLVLVLLVPLSRFSRLDVVMGGVAILVLFTALPIFKLTAKRWLALACAIILLAVAVAELGSLRQNRLDKYAFKYSSFIAWQGAWSGPAEIFPILYGYFSLSFENLDVYVRQFRGDYGIALTSFDWLFTGFLKLNWFTSYAFAQADQFQFMPISSAANVPTALTPFYSDLGPIGMAIPMLLYVSFWLYLYHRSRQSARALLLYAVYSGAFSMVSFQAVIAAPFLFHQLAAVWIVIGLAAWMERARARRAGVMAARRAITADLLLR